jgi:hypothetical protein
MRPSLHPQKLRELKESRLLKDHEDQLGRRRPNCLPVTLLDPRPQSLSA